MSQPGTSWCGRSLPRISAMAWCAMCADVRFLLSQLTPPPPAMKTTTTMLLLASSAMAATTTTAPTTAPTGGVTPTTPTTAPAGGVAACSAETINAAWKAVKADAKASGDKCATDLGLASAEVLETLTNVTPAQIEKYATSTNCAAYYVFSQKSFASVKPPCAMTATTTTADWATFTIQQYTDALKATIAAANSTTVAPGGNTTTSVPGAATTKPTSVSSSTGSSAGTTTKAPTPKPTSSAAGLTTGLVALATVAVAAM
ncbi:hypothetical protein SDRG_09760 [Saprolegnia diclina VS20]|uniref:Uncharacterized protein n=1 Tax=Saprolegnia diclina (strain VS20) TaxID=1156394 RepID=T0Q4M8_SAPDV|nr:hypothetical protein SDRG_09760 [Saprolegnia diclina VS20]EQC32789.1 hypothetical protein SDRG_09760 [Saprolegnia diclina VS20]|eukprot:XP_008613933.1 hypothetical protein SDRG_09760 [Saprolegnia diclina VS20]